VLRRTRRVIWNCTICDAVRLFWRRWMRVGFARFVVCCVVCVTLANPADTPKARSRAADRNRAMQASRWRQRNKSVSNTWSQAWDSSQASDRLMDRHSGGSCGSTFRLRSHRKSSKQSDYASSSSDCAAAAVEREVRQRCASETWRLSYAPKGSALTGWNGAWSSS